MTVSLVHSSRIGQTARSPVRVPSYLYRKRDIYYFRYAIPKNMQDSLGGSEIRLCLRTAYIRHAKPLADKLYSALCNDLKGQQMLSLQEIKGRLAALLAKLAEGQANTFGAIQDNPLYGEPFEALSAEEIRDEQKALYQSKARQRVMYADWLADKHYNRLTDSVDTKRVNEILDQPFQSEDFFALYTERHADYLVREGFFTQEEIEEGKAPIGKAMMQTALLFNEYRIADEEGDAVAAQKILTDYVGTVDFLPAQAVPQQLAQPPKKLAYSEAIERYKTEKIKQNKWKNSKSVNDHLASTNLNELGFRVDVIETQLAHKEPDSVRLAYNRAQYMEERRKMMQAWADWLDATRAKA